LQNKFITANIYRMRLTLQMHLSIQIIVQPTPTIYYNKPKAGIYICTNEAGLE